MSSQDASQLTIRKYVDRWSLDRAYATAYLVDTQSTIEHGEAILDRDRCATHEVDMTDREKTVETRPPLPPFTRETAALKVRLAEDGWNSRSPEKVALAYSVDSRWRNRAEFVNGRQEIVCVPDAEMGA